VIVGGDKIAAVAKDAQPPQGAPHIKVDGIILPGFIDLHNHLTWNVFPRWRPTQKFSSRYEWQATPEYDQALRIPQGRMMANGLGCKANLFAEVKALAGGATSIAGSLIGQMDPERTCVVGLVRNLDHSSGFAKAPSQPACAGEAPTIPAAVANEVFPMEAKFERLNWLRCELQQGTLRGLLVHLAEGKPNDATARREFRMLQGQGLLQPGLVIIHGTALTVEDFVAMRDKSGLVWSPRSNDELYGGGPNIGAALAVGVNVAIAPDWSPTGSAGMIPEINYAAARHYAVRPKQYVAMASSAPAQMVRLDDRIGTLAPGKIADLLVIRSRGGAPYETVVTATPADILLVAVDGTPLYGDPVIMSALLPGKKLEELTVCGEKKMLFLESALPDGSWDAVRGQLEAELKRYGSSLGPIECS